MRSILTYYVVVLFGLSSCAQTKKKQDKDMNSIIDKYVERIASQVKRYNYEPIYYMRINKNYCLVEVLVNDFPIHSDYQLSNYATPIEINHAILKSGTQTLTYRLYPVEDLIKQEYGYGDTVTTLVDNTSLSISIIEVDNRSDKKLDDEKVVMTHTTILNKEGDFVASGKPYYEFTFEFEAKVPYELEGWSSGKDLTKVDSILLRPRVVKFYKKVKEIYENKDLESYLSIFSSSDLIGFQTYYYDKEKIKKAYQHEYEVMNNPTSKIQSFNSFELVFYGNKKLVFLSQKEMFYRLRKKSSLWLKYEKEDRIRAKFFGLYLYMPKGGDELKVI